MNQRCQIFEVYKGAFLSKNSLTESQVGVPAGMMRVTGVAAVIGVMNRNNRIYTKDNYLKHIQLLQDDIAEGLYGELEHPDGFTINNNNISHKIEAVWFNEATNEVMITLLLLDTEKGKIAQSIINSGGKLRVSSRAMGSVGKNNEAVITKLVTFDIVGTPGFAQSNLHLSENMKKIASDDLCESFILLNENNKEDMSNQNLKKLQQAQQKLKQCNQLKQCGQQKMSQDAGTVVLDQKTADLIERWVVSEVLPTFESYMNRKAINESMGKTSCSFPKFVEMQRGLNEAQQQIAELDEDDDELTQDDNYLNMYQSKQSKQQLRQQQHRLQQAQDAEELRESLAIAYSNLLESEDPLEQEQLAQECDELRQQIAELDEDDDDTVNENQQQLRQCQQKIQQGQQLTDEDIEGLTQDQLEQLIDHQQSLEEAENIDEDEDEDEVNQCHNLRQKRQQLRQQQQIREGQSTNPQQLPQDQQLTQGQQLAQQLCQDQQLTQSQERVLQKLQQGDQLTQNQQEVLKQMQQDGVITQNQLRVLQQCQQLPESDEEVNESLIGRRASRAINAGSSLLESVSRRVRMARGSKN